MHVAHRVHRAAGEHHRATGWRSHIPERTQFCGSAVPSARFSRVSAQRKELRIHAVGIHARNLRLRAIRVDCQHARGEPQDRRHLRAGCRCQAVRKRGVDEPAAQFDRGPYAADALQRDAPQIPVERVAGQQRRGQHCRGQSRATRQRQVHAAVEAETADEPEVGVHGLLDENRGQKAEVRRQIGTYGSACKPAIRCFALIFALCRRRS